jgi:hypothetical protein
MGQSARPSADISDGGWAPSPLFSKLNELLPDDGSFVSSPDDPDHKTFEVQLSKMAAPKAGAQQLRVRLRRTNTSANIYAKIMLLQGEDTIIAERIVRNPSTDFEDYVLNVSAAEQQEITNYEDLHVSVMANLDACAACADGTPDSYNLSFSGVANGTCADCGWWNNHKPFILPHAGEGMSPCSWDLNTLGTDWPCNNTSNNLLVQIGGGFITVTLNLAGGGSIVWRKPLPVNCLAPGPIPYFTQFGPSTLCDWTGSSITLEGQ